MKYILTLPMRCLIEFVFPRRLHRVTYFVRGVAANTVAYFVYDNSTMMDSRLWWVCVIALLTYFLCFVVLPRLRDAGMSPWWLLVTFIPVADLVLCLLLLFRAPSILAGRAPHETAAPNCAPEDPPEASSAGGAARVGSMKTPLNPRP